MSAPLDRFDNGQENRIQFLQTTPIDEVDLLASNGSRRVNRMRWSEASINKCPGTASSMKQRQLASSDCKYFQSDAVTDAGKTGFVTSSLCLSVHVKFVSGKTCPNSSSSLLCVFFILIWLCVCMFIWVTSVRPFSIGSNISSYHTRLDHLIAVLILILDWQHQL